mgnify:CR=1 FL=1
MGDDGIGLRLAETISDRGLDKGFRAVEIAHDLLKLLTWFDESTERILVVDCVRMGRSPGEFAFFRPDDVISDKSVGGLSTHEGDLLKVIELAEQLGQFVPRIRIMGIEPQSMEQGMKLSAILQGRFEIYLNAAVAEISKVCW